MAKQRGAAEARSGIAKRRAAAKADASEHYQGRRKDIVHAAAEVFRAKGVAKTSIDDIARVAGVDRATLYYYVGSKDELFREVVLDAVVSNIELSEKIAKGDDPPEKKLEQLVAGVLASYAQFYPHIFVYLREDPETLPPPSKGGADIVDLQRRFDRALTSIVREGIDSGAFRADIPPRLAAYGVIGMLNWTHRWFKPDGPVDADDIAKAFSTLTVEGLRNR